jgi:hypothetical protein
LGEHPTNFEGKPATPAEQAFKVKIDQETYSLKGQVPKTLIGGTTLTQQATDTKEKTSKTVYQHFKALIARFSAPREVKAPVAEPEVILEPNPKKEEAFSTLKALMENSDTVDSAAVKNLNAYFDQGKTAEKKELIDEFAKLLNDPKTSSRAIEILTKMSHSTFPASELLRKIGDNAAKLDLIKGMLSLEAGSQKAATFLRTDNMTTKMITAFQNQLLESSKTSSKIRDFMKPFLSQSYKLKPKDFDSKAVDVAGLSPAEQKIVMSDRQKLLDNLPKILKGLNSIVSSDEFPKELKELNKFFSDLVAEKFPESSQTEKDRLAANPFFLRYLNPLITLSGATNPKYASAATYITKAVQNLANRVTEDRKEPELAFLLKDNENSKTELSSISSAITAK